jgi:peptidoglycan/xylan/chitin deacetylase (PgdA/CDA1 family)
MIRYSKIMFRLFLVAIITVSCRNKTHTSENGVVRQTGSGNETVIPKAENEFTYESGAIIRGDTTTKKIALVFTGDEFADGGEFIAETLKNKDIRGSFFFTGNFYRNEKFKPVINRLISNGNYLGSHSDKHLLYCDWIRRDSLLVGRAEFMNDIRASYEEMGKFGIDHAKSHFYLPPYEWYNDSISLWTNRMGLELVNFSPGTRSNADYTYPQMAEKYLDSKTILKSVLDYEKFSPNGLNGFILLVHIGTDPRRTDKFYSYLPYLIDTLINRDYQFVRIDDLLK